MKNRLRRGRGSALATSPEYALVNIVRIPDAQMSPGRAIGRRILFALLALDLHQPRVKQAVLASLPVSLGLDRKSVV